MKTAITKTESQKQDDVIQMARLRVEIAEGRWQEAKDAAKEARRKRKEAKEVARQAKKEAKQAKAELAEARSLLKDTEAKLVSPDEHVEQETPLSDSDDEFPTDSAPTATTMEKLPEPEPRKPMGNWR